MASDARQLVAEERFRRQVREANRTAARFKVRHMNDTKWREVFTVLNARRDAVGLVLLKFTDQPDPLPFSGQFGMVADMSFDSWHGPILYRELEWMDVPRRYAIERGTPGTPAGERLQVVDQLRERLDLHGKLPIRDTADGFRITGYE